MTKTIRSRSFPIILFTVVAFGAWTTAGYAWQQEPNATPQQNHYSRIAVAIARAKAAGVNEITLLAPIVLPTGVATVDDLIRDYTLLRVIVEDATTLVGDQGVETWYKLGVLEVLNRQAKVGDAPLPQPAPLRLAPLTGSEVFYAVTGGTAVVDGITITEPPVDAGLMLQKGHEYVGGFFLEAGGQLADTAALSASLYELDKDELKPQGRPQHPLVRDFRDYLGNRLSALRDTLRRQVGVPNTSLR